MEDEKPDQVYLDKLEELGAPYNRRYSAIWERILAYAVDILIVTLGAWLIRLSFNRASPGSFDAFRPYFKELTIFPYTILLHAKYGKTVGKKLMGLKVIDESEAKGISVLQAALRDSIPLLLAFTLFLPVRVGSSEFTSADYFGLVYLAWFLAQFAAMRYNGRRRALHDFMAGTVVVKA